MPPRAAGRRGVQPPADSATVEKIKAAGKLVGGIGQVLPWTGLDTSTNKYYGATVLIAEEIAKRIGVPLELKAVGNDIVVQEVGRATSTSRSSRSTSTPSASKSSTVPRHKGGFCYLVLKDNDKINTLADLDQDGVRLQALRRLPVLRGVQEEVPQADARVAATDE